MKRTILVLLILTFLPVIGLEAQNAEPGDDPYEISQSDFFIEGSAPVRKSGPYDVTIVYFMDYQCPSCRQYTPDVARVLEEDRRIRVIYRDTPLLGPRSEAAAKAAIASHFQGRHEAFHHALMMTKGPLDEHALRAAAAKAKVDWPRLQRDLASRSDEVDEVILRNHELAAATGIQGTPAFIVGERQSNGALNYNLLKAEIADARKAGAINVPSGGPERGVPAEPDPAKTKPDSGSGTVKAAAAEKDAIFIPAKPIGDNAIRSSDASDDDSLWAWLVATLVALAGSVGVWKFFAQKRSAKV